MYKSLCWAEGELRDTGNDPEMILTSSGSKRSARQMKQKRGALSPVTVAHVSCRRHGPYGRDVSQTACAERLRLKE